VHTPYAVHEHARVCTASGAGGQWIFVVREKDLVVTFTSDVMNPDFFGAVEVFFREVLPAVS